MKEPVAYFNWGSSNHSNDEFNEDCVVMMRNGTWKTVTCFSEAENIMCEKKIHPKKGKQKNTI